MTFIFMILIHRMKPTFLFILILLLTACQKPKDEVKTIHIIEGKNLKLSEFIEEVSFISLPEKVNGYFFDKFIESENYFILGDIQSSLKIYILTKNFELVSIINNYGEGPDQYQTMLNIAFNEESQLVEILTLKNILRYSIAGEFINSAEVPITWINNLVHDSGDDYIMYPQNQSHAINSHTDFLVKWNPEKKTVTPIIQHKVNEGVISFKDVNNLTKHRDTIYASHVFLDTIYTLTKGELGKILLKFPKENLPLELLTYEVIESQNSLLDSDNYSYHYPLIKISDQFLLSSYVTNNSVNFFILNKLTNKVIAGSKFIDDLNLGMNWIQPKHIDNEGYFYAIHQFEYIWMKAKNSQADSQVSKYLNQLEIEPNFVVVKYKLKNF